MDLKGFLYREEYRRDCYKLLADCYYLPDQRLFGSLNCLDKSKGGVQGELARLAPESNNIER